MKALHAAGGVLLGAAAVVLPMAVNIMDTPAEMWDKHQATLRQIERIEWGIRTFPQENQ